MQDLISDDPFSLLTICSPSGIHPRSLPTADGFFGGQPRTPMLLASHIATALSAATGRSDRPNGRLLVGARGYWGVPSFKNGSEQSSRLKPE